MNFLTPLSLAFAALSIPILLLYMLKMRRREVWVSSTFLWRRLLRDREANTPWQRLRRNLLLFLQLLTLALLVLALARPFLPILTLVEGNVVILLDGSASMQATDVAPTRFEAARRAALDLIAGLGPNDVATVILVGPQPQVLLTPTSNRTALRRALKEVQPTDGPADWEAAFALASALAAGVPESRFVLLSDGAVPESLPPLPGEARFLQVGERGDNLAILALAMREGPTGPQALLRAANFGEEPAQTRVAFRADGVPFDVRSLSIPPRGTATLVLDDLPYDLRLLEAELEAEDPLPLDDVAWTVRAGTGGRRVLLVTPGNLFLERALGALPGVDLTRLSPGQPFPEEPSDLVVADGPLTTTLPAGNLWVVGPYDGATEVFTDTQVVGLATDDPILRYVDWTDVHVLRAWRVEPPPGARVLVQAEGGPLLMVAERPEGRLAVLTFDLHDSDLPLRIAFPILVANLTGWLLPAGGVGAAADLRPGDLLPVQPTPEAVRIEITGPDGEARSPSDPADQVGVYRADHLDADGALLRSDLFAVNLFDAVESDIGPRDTVVVGEAEVAATTREAEGRRELWPWLAAVALGVMGAEWWAYHRGGGWPRGRYGRGRAWAAPGVRCLIAALIVLSLAGLRAVHGGDELAVVFLVDVSDSISQDRQARAWGFVEESLAAMGPDDRAAVVVFGADALVERPMSADRNLGEVASVPRTHQTNLAAAIRLGLALFPQGAAHRMVVLTDGRPTVGDAEAALRLAHAQGIEVDLVDLGDSVPVEAWLTDLDLPARLYPGESFTLLVTAHSTGPTEATLTVLSGDRVVARQTVRLAPGPNRFAVPLTAGEPGFFTYRVLLTPVDDAFPQNNDLFAFTRVEGPPRVLLVAGAEADPRPLREALRAAGMEAQEVDATGMPSDPAALADYGAVALVDTPAQALSPRAMAALQSYVRDLGGGLVAVGGPHAYGVGGWFDTPLEETLPVEMTVRDPDRFPPMSIVVVIDKSGSMAVAEGGVQKIRLAGEAAARVAELINDADEITVIAFDDRPADVIGPLTGSEREAVIDQVIRLQAGGGGIYVRESLQAALEVLKGSDRTVRHILLLADGSDAEHQEGVRELVEEEIAAEGITLSTVAIGAGQDLAFLEEIAQRGGGRYYFTGRATDLPTIFAQETQLAMRSYIVEEPFYPRQTASSPILEGIDVVPRLLGYVATTPKPAAQVILATHQDDPLLTAWQYGLGRAVAWTSDAMGRWAGPWVGWEGFGRFWAQVVRWTLAQSTDLPVGMEVSLQGRTARVVVDAVDDGGGFVNGMEGTVRVVGPTGETADVDLVQVAPGRYEGAFEPWAEGVYLLRLDGRLPDGDAVGMTTGWALGYSPEYAALETDPEAVARLAEMGGGRVLTEPAEAFTHDLRGEGVARDLWPLLLTLATLLWPVDVALRRLALGRRDLERARDWIARRLPRREPRPVVEAPSPVARLLQTKERAEQRPAPPPAATSVGAPPRLAEPPPPPVAPAAPPQPSPKPSTPSPEGETLAERLLRRKREQGR